MRSVRRPGEAATAASSSRRGRLRVALCSVLLSASLLGPAAIAAQILGPGPLNSPVGLTPSAIATGDFNNDNVPDLAVTSIEDTVSILLGDGLGGFTRSDLPVGFSPTSVAVGDFNADGAADLAVGECDRSRIVPLGRLTPDSGGPNAGTVRVLLGDDRGGFTLSAQLDVDPCPPALAVADLNADSILDLAVASVGSGTVSIFLGDGLGGFSRVGKKVQVGLTATSLAVGDFDRDGIQDLAVTSVNQSLEGNMNIFRGDGSGGFSLGAQIPLGLRPSSIATGDFDANGAADLVTTNEGSNSITLLLGDGLGGFSLIRDLPVGDQPTHLAVGDFNSDGASDVAVANGGTRTVSLLIGDGLGNFSRTDITVGDAPTFVALLDLNADGSEDLVVGVGNAGGQVNILLGDGVGNFSKTVNYAVGAGPSSIAIGDFNADEANDLAVANFGSQSVTILLGDGLGGFSRAADLVVDGYPTSVALGDFDTDGDVDLAVGNDGGATVSILLGDGHGGFSGPTDLPIGVGPRRIAVGDFDRDGAIDLAVTGGNAVSILLGDGHGRFPLISQIALGHLTSDAVVGDFNSDGAPDLVVTSSVFAGTLNILLGDGQGGFPKISAIPVDSPTGVAVGDFDADGRADLVVTGLGVSAILGPGFPGPGKARILKGDGAGGFSLATEITLGLGPSSPKVADFNADGEEDLAIVNGISRSVTLLLGNGLGNFSSISEFQLGDPGFLATGELNGDGAPDVALTERTGAVTILYNQLALRTDLNGSNRTDGFDVSTVGRLFGCHIPNSCYRNTVDVNLDGIIDGDDLALIAPRFGETNKTASPLRATVATALPPDVDTIVFRQTASEGDLLTVEVFVNSAASHEVAAANFIVTFEPADARSDQVLQLEGFEPGTYLAGGGVLQLYGFDDRSPGRVGVAVSRFPSQNKNNSSPEPLLSLFLRARRPGEAKLEFAPFERVHPALLDSSGQDVSGISFGPGVLVNVENTGGGPPGRIALSPGHLDFGTVPVGASVRKLLRIFNFGFSKLTILDISSPQTEVSSFFTDDFTIPAFGFINLSVIFTPSHPGVFSGELVIVSDDPLKGLVRLPLTGGSEPSP